MIKPILFFLFSIPSFIYSQNSPNFSDADYIEKMDNSLNLKLDIDNDIQSFEFDDGATSYNIEPNTSMRMSLSVNYRFISFRIGYSPKFLSNDEEHLKGKTKVFKFQADMYMKNWMQSFEFSSVKGYYISNYEDTNNPIDPGYGEFVILPDLKTFTINGTTRYKFNKNFSYKAIFNQNEIQRKSAGSFIPSLTYGYFQISDNRGIQDLDTFGIILNTGYFYTFVINQKWFSSFGLSPGLGIEFNKSTTKSDEGNLVLENNEIVFNLDSHLGFGYNSESFYAGTNFRMIGTSRSDNSIVKFNTARGIFLLFVGYRFNSPEIVKEGVDWLEDQNPFK